MTLELTPEQREEFARAGRRAARCGHPYRIAAPRRGLADVSGSEWSRCDERCTHGGEIRLLDPSTERSHVEEAADGTTIQSYRECGYVVEAHWRILTVHHLDNVKANCRWWNLAPLCQRCHLTIQGKVRMDRRWLAEHTPWFRPYVAAYYAFVYLDEDLTLEQTLARLPELLDLEHRQEALI